MKKYNKTYVGFTKFCIFSTQLEGVVESNLSEASIKKALGENAAIIKKDNVGGIKVIQNEACGVLIEAKGLGDDIGVVAGSPEAQNALVNEVAKFLEKTAITTETEVGFFKKMFGSLFYAGAASVVTCLLYFASIEASVTGETLAGQFSGKKGILASITEIVGANGILIMGGVVVEFLLFSGVKKAKAPLTVNEISFQ